MSFILLATAANAVAIDTFGLVVETTGEAYVVDPTDGQVMDADEKFTVISVGNELLLSEDSLIRVIDQSGNRLTFFGPAHISFDELNKIDVSYGLTVVESKKPGLLKFESAFIAGTTDVTAVVWVGEKRAQWLSLYGASNTWHPLHTEVKMPVPQGMFTENSVSEYYLEPRLSMDPELKRVKNLLGKFHDPRPEVVAKETHKEPAHGHEAPHVVVPTKHIKKIEIYSALEPEPKVKALPQPQRAIASVPADNTHNDAVVAPKKPTYRTDPEAMLARLKAKLEGVEYVEAPVKVVVKKVDPASQKRLEEHKRKVAKIMDREKAYREALHKNGSVGGSAAAVRAPASHQEPIEVDEDERVDLENGILNRLIKRGKK